MRISDWSSDVCSSDLRYSWRNKVEQLRIEPISQASANQRAGRCGRIGPGVCVRLYAEGDFKARAPFTDPEVLRSSLASVILRMKALKDRKSVGTGKGVSGRVDFGGGGFLKKQKPKTHRQK